ncbi:hypothetical protein [Nocardioides convexus]|uniref:hypothetical protein n=1 Tax=Nocardioides convexus TaxID=2712224 RepID=UPI0024185E9F|nr:hypothetical protein [Nocardioides convexus]
MPAPWWAPSSPGGTSATRSAWIGDRAERADDRIAGSLAAAGCAVVAVVAALLLERACRVRDDDEPA